MKVDSKIKKFCPHCKHESVQVYLLHHVYDESNGGLWNGDAETAKTPASYFCFVCQTCEQVLLYHYYADDFNFESLFECRINGVECMTWDKTEIQEELELLWPRVGEEIHQYVPVSVRKLYLKALRTVDSPDMFAIEIRKTMEQICKERGIDSKDVNGRHRTLSEMTNELCTTAMLPESIREIAKMIIKAGNRAAHSALEGKSIPLLQNFFRVFLNHVYVLPMQVQEWSSSDDQKRGGLENR